jgi:hypothetical protein
VLVVGVGWLVTNHLQRPTERVYTAEADTYVTTAHPNANFGTATILRSDSTPKIRSYLRFRLHGLAGRIVRAELRLWSRTGDVVGYAVHSVASSSWAELATTLNNGPATEEPEATSGPFGPDSWSSAEVTRLVQANRVVSLMLTTTSHQNIVFDSREATHQPQLVVRTTAGPSAAATSVSSPQWLRGAIEDVVGATGLPLVLWSRRTGFSLHGAGLAGLELDWAAHAQARYVRVGPASLTSRRLAVAADL